MRELKPEDLARVTGGIVLPVPGGIAPPPPLLPLVLRQPTWSASEPERM